MIAAKTLKRYISKIDDLLLNLDEESADALITQIVNVLISDIKDIPFGLRLYGPSLDTDYPADLRLLREKLQKELDVLEPDNNDNTEKKANQNRNNKIFISHATKDNEYVKIIVQFLESLGLSEQEIICSSVPPYCVPLGNNVYDWLVNEFRESNLHVLFILSKVYYSRPVCLNEMGAAWALKHKYTAMLLPGFEYSDIAGCIDSYEICIKLDDKSLEILNYRLNELKELIISEFELRPLSFTKWERIRDEFLSNINRIHEKHSTEELPEELESEGLDPGSDAMELLKYAAVSGIITTDKILENIDVSVDANGFLFAAGDNIRESARWKSAVEELEKAKMIEVACSKEQYTEYHLTKLGYVAAERAMEIFPINTNLDPQLWL